MSFTTTYKELLDYNGKNTRDRIRHLALDGLSIVSNISSDKYLKKPRVQFLYIHHSFVDEEKSLEKLLAKLQEKHTFISYNAAVNKVLSGNIDRPYISISSDDGFKNNLRAAKILSRFGIQACFFINPALIGETNFDNISKYCRYKLNFPPVEFLNWNEIDEIKKLGHEIGSHTMDHIDITKFRNDVVAENINESFHTLLEKCGEAKHFAFPYGRFSNFNEDARKVVFETGFISCASAERGCHISVNTSLRAEELCIRRDHIILDWKLSHILFFLTLSSKKAVLQNNYFPYNK